MQGIFKKLKYFYPCFICNFWIYFTLILYLLSPEICVRNINELAEYGMIWTDEDGFLVKPLGQML